MQRIIRRLALLAAAATSLAAWAAPAAAQVTTASIRGIVTDSVDNPIEGVRITAVHVPSGTQYVATSRASGTYTIPAVRVGGPFRITATRIGYSPQSRENITTSLGVATDVNFRLAATATQIAAVTVTSTPDIASTRTGAATSVNRAQLEQLPTISRRIDDFTRLTPQASGSSFAGADNRLNNITVDGSFFNNSFGLAGQPGDRTGVAPISLDAIEAVQVNIAPYDVRQGSFVGAAVNTVTKSGTNNFDGSLYYLFRNQDLVGTRAGVNDFNPGTFDFSQIGARLGGPIIKNKLFFFASYEQDDQTRPGTLFTANPGGAPATGNVTRVLESDLLGLQRFLRDSLGYDPGGFQGYSFGNPSKRLLGKLDFNASDRNKFSLRYTQLDSETDVLISTSGSLGQSSGGARRGQNSLPFQGSNYTILENIRSLVGEWNVLLGSNMSNQLIAGYTENDESRGAIPQLFPFVDILEAGTNYTAFGAEPFTPNNELRYKSYQIQNNFTIYGDKHDLTFGGAAEWYESENVFFPGSQSAYVYNSLADFYTDARDYLANPNRTTSPVTLNRFQVRYANIPGQTKPVQPLEVLFAGLYAQDEFRATRNLTMTFGLRVDVPRFGNTGFTNTQANGLDFRDETGATVRYQTEKLPDANLLWSPRLGLNWDVNGDGVTQVRGGTGIFTGRPAYVWISNQIGNNGLLTGFINETNTAARPFNPDPDAYKPAPTGNPASSYELALTDPDFKFPQVWRSNVAVDRKLPWDLTGTVEFLYSQDVNGIYYINANLPAAQTAFTGADTRPRWTSNRINANIPNAIVLKNQDVGTSWNIAASLERAFRNGLFAKAAYSYGIARNTVDPGSIAFGTINGNAMVNDPNNPGLGLSGNTLGHRFFTTVAYQKDFFSFGTTGVSVFFEGRTLGNYSYIINGDANGDGFNSNDLVYVPRDQSEMNFRAYTNGGRTYTPAEQAAAWDAFINQDPYLRTRRGQYAERGAAFLPMVWRADLTFTQDIGKMVGGTRNKVQLRADVLNVTNLLNRNWGLARTAFTTSPLQSPQTDTQGRMSYTLRNVSTGGALISETLQQNPSFSDVWRLQFGVRYNFSN